MENLEWLSGQPLLLDETTPALSGPVINSRRQLWSVGGYLGMVIDNVFGVTVEDDGIALRPFVTAKLRRETFGATNEIALHDLHLHGKRIDVVLRLPPAAEGDGYHRVERILLNGKQVGDTLRTSNLQAENRIEIVLGKLVAGAQGIRRVQANPYEESSVTFGPREPVIEALTRASSGAVGLTIGANGNAANVTYRVYRDGKLVADKLPAGAWTDDKAGVASCYAVEARFADSGNVSHHSQPRCIDGVAGTGVDIGVTDPRVTSNLTSTAPDARFSLPAIRDWGRPQDRFAVDGMRVESTGDYRIQVRYHNGANQVNLGISGGVKWLALKNSAGKIVAQGVIQLPHAPLFKGATPTVYSTPLAARLTAGSYRLEMTDFYNMSYLESNRTFTGAGGAEPANRFDIHGVRLLRVK